MHFTFEEKPTLMEKPIRGRGAQHQAVNNYLEHHYEVLDDYLNYCAISGEEADSNRTEFITVFPKTIVNTVKSPDVSMGYSLNPYQGCEHGCVYCYARNSHEYWGYNAGLDFERKILIKKNAPKLLEKFLLNKNWTAYPIVLSGNTDCYQPIERKEKLTRQLLQLFLKFKHPVGIITKNALILRDLDILQELAQHQLIHVSISLNSLDESLRRKLEPRTASVKMRLQAIETLATAGIPVNVMVAPVIPGLNSHEILPVVRAVTERGALSIGHTVVRLNGKIGEVFTEWIRRTMPDRADKVLHQIADCHGGQLNDSRFGQRMRGEGNIAAQIQRQVEIARNKYLKNKTITELNTTQYPIERARILRASHGQLELF